MLDMQADFYAQVTVCGRTVTNGCVISVNLLFHTLQYLSQYLNIFLSDCWLNITSYLDEYSYIFDKSKWRTCFNELFAWISVYKLRVIARH